MAEPIQAEGENMTGPEQMMTERCGPAAFLGESAAVTGVAGSGAAGTRLLPFSRMQPASRGWNG
jgi:hypothetical protein